MASHGGEGYDAPAPSTAPAVVAPTKPVKPKSLTFRFELEDTDKVTTTFMNDVKAMDDTRKKEMVAELSQEIKSLLMKRQYLLEIMKGDKDTSNDTHADDVEIITIVIRYGEVTYNMDIKCDMTFATLRDEACKHFSIIKSKWKTMTLVNSKGSDCLTSSRASVCGSSAKKNNVDLKPMDVINLVMNK